MAKCEYKGYWSGGGCNEDAVPGTRFCNAHRTQGRDNEIRRKLYVWMFLIFVGLLFLLIVCSI